MKQILAKVYGLMPAIMTVLGFLIIGYRLVMEFLHNPDTNSKIVMGIVCCMYAGWLTFESRVTRNEASKELSSHDKFSMEFCAIVKITLLLTFFYPPLMIDPVRAGAGIVLAFAGIILRTRAIATLGTLYSHRIRDPERVIDTGIYGVIRHPAYLGTALAHAGFTLVFLNYLSITMLAVWFFAVWLRVFLEEKALRDHVAYGSYKQRVRAKIIPGLW